MKAVAFDAETGRLDVAPDIPAAGTHLRWSAPKLVTAANERVRGANVRALHVLAPAPVKAGSATATAEPAPQPTKPATPGAARESAGGLTRGHRRPPRHMDDHPAHQPEAPPAPSTSHRQPCTSP